MSLRCRLRSQWLRWSRWEYWPALPLYFPVMVRLLPEALRLGGPRTVTAANPGIELGGLVGESKSAILAGIRDPEAVARWKLIPMGSMPDRLAEIEAFREEIGVRWPLVLKADRGERGSGVHIVRSDGEVAIALRDVRIPLIAQEFVPGEEFGVLWYRMPGEERGHVYSLARKSPEVLVGDGSRTIAELLCANDRTLALIGHHRRRHADRLDEVLRPGETFAVTELGTHSLGATFVDTPELLTDALEERIDGIARSFEGFDFGRFDLRVPDTRSLREGKDLKVLELNGLSAESAHMYDPATGWGRAVSLLCAQWSLALRIGAGRRDRGGRVAGWGEIWRAWRAHLDDRPLRGG